jgi:hypothetical protein
MGNHHDLHRRREKGVQDNPGGLPSTLSCFGIPEFLYDEEVDSLNALLMFQDLRPKSILLGAFELPFLPSVFIDMSRQWVYSLR